MQIIVKEIYNKNQAHEVRWLERRARFLSFSLGVL